MSNSTKSTIVTVAKQLFGKNGFEATSIREIADKGNVNVAAISYHFGSKNGLFEALVKDFAEKRLYLIAEVLDPAESIEDFKLKISLFMNSFLALGVDDPDSFQVVHKNLDLFAELAPKYFSETFVSFHGKILEFIKGAQKAGIVSKNHEAIILTQILFGGLVELIRGNPLRKKFLGVSLEDKKFRKKYIDSFIQCFLYGAGELND